MYIALTESEIGALRGMDHSLWVLYLHLKQFMDYSSGVVGYARRISYQSISEALYVEPRQGVKGGSPHISSIRRMLDQLIKHDVIKKSRSDTLVFKLHLADTDFYNQNKADMKPTGKGDTPKANKHKALSSKADIPNEVKADIPHLSLNTINKPTSLHSNHSMGEVAKVDDDAQLHFHKSLHEETVQAMQKMLKGFQHEKQQELLDELSWYISKKKISATPTGLLVAMIKQAKNGAFFAANAHLVKKERENPKPSAIEKPRTELTPEQREANKEKGRAAMGNVKQLFKRKATA